MEGWRNREGVVSCGTYRLSSETNIKKERESVIQSEISH
jgi:hypothetical protein